MIYEDTIETTGRDRVEAPPLCSNDFQTAKRRQNVIQTVTGHISSAKPFSTAIYAGLPDFAIPENVTNFEVKPVTRVREKLKSARS